MRDREELQAQLDALHDQVLFQVAMLKDSLLDQPSNYDWLTADISRCAARIQQYNRYEDELTIALKVLDTHHACIIDNGELCWEVEPILRAKRDQSGLAWVSILSTQRVRYLSNGGSMPDEDTLDTMLLERATYQVLDWILDDKADTPWQLDYR